MTTGYSKRRGVQLLLRARDGVLDRLLVVQGLVSAAILALAALVFFPLSMVTSDFGESCILNANIVIGPSIGNGTIQLDVTKSRFGDIDDCNFCIYINVALAIASAIFIWFFIHSKEVTDTKTSQLRLLFPVFALHLVFFICNFSSSLKITNGNREWCSYLSENNKYEKKTIPCWEYERHDWIPNTISSFYSYTHISEVCSWILTVVLALQLSLTVLHIHRDYSLWFVAGLTDDTTSKLSPPPSGDNASAVVDMSPDGSNRIREEQHPSKFNNTEQDVESETGSLSDKRSLIPVDVHSDST